MVKTKYILLVAAVMLSIFGVHAQTDESGVIYVEPLFEYPTAPDYLDNISVRSDYLMDNFWKGMDFKKKIVDQAAMNHAMKVYITAMQWASKGKVLNSVDNLLDKSKKNPTLLYQIVKAAEENLYGPRAEIYIDEVFTRFLNAAISNKKMPKSKADHFRTILNAMNSTEQGMVIPDIELTTLDGNEVSKSLGKNNTVVLFGKSSDANFRQAMLRITTLVPLQRLIDSGDVAIWVVNNEEQNVASDEFLEGISDNIVAGYLQHADEVVDLRMPLSVYLLDGEGKILLKNVDLPTALVNIKATKEN